MGKHYLSFSLPFILPFLIHAQPSLTGYTCSPNQSIYPCQTYALYRASAPNFLDLGSIGDLFGLSRLMISKPNNLSSPSTTLSPDQNLLIPITCSCTSNHSYANVTYQINAGDTFWFVSTSKFQNLTTYQAVELVNPSLVPTNLTIGVQVIFPIFCQCPTQTQLQNRINFIITYLSQPSDTLSSIASKFGSNIQSLISVNRQTNVTPFSTILVPVSQTPQLEQPSISPSPLPSISSPPSVQSRERKGVIIGLSIGLGVLGIFSFLLVIVMVWLLWGFSRRGVKEEEKRLEPLLHDENFMADVSDCLDKYKLYRIQELREATQNFDPSCVIQGSVYKGSLKGEVCAIKRMKWNAYEELKILQKVNHSNLVKLEGFCIDPEEGNCYLVYEYVENGSLHSWLHWDRQGKKLDWKTRLQIAVDVANGLQYIHEHTRPSVVHKDIKSSNILLDGNMRAKIANFGLAKSGTNAITMHIVGTQGYLSPEYIVDGLVTPKMDVFAFGVVLLELVSGKEAVDDEGKVLWMEAERVFEGAKDKRDEMLVAMVDEALVDQSCSMDTVMNVLAIARACLKREVSKRPSMVDIFYMLCKADELYFDFSEDGIVPTGVMAR
ncbi:serine/threonine receptor-like kinase NFP [Tasmannia lanceolata]|uniref:serine/threonine receptor-like kinase NFP n=1 Tax=Tasmannia lanceolata TaxID=3420 RepID=UPI004064A7CE